jgi:curved DNA-binding protein CbpA
MPDTTSTTKSTKEEGEGILTRMTHYDVLGISSTTASYDDIKSSFHKLARQSHPDKQQQQQQQNHHPTTTAVNFKRIQQAWEILRNDELRKSYNDELQQQALSQKKKTKGAIEISWKEDTEEAVDEETGQSIYIYDCRCGEEVIIWEEETETVTTTTADDDDDDQYQYVDCPGCCFVYKIMIVATTTTKKSSS